MASNLLDRPQLPVDVHVWLAKGCKKLQVEKPEGSGVFVRAKKCCFCQQSVQLGAGSADYSLTQHMLSKKCQKSQRYSNNVPQPPHNIAEHKPLDMKLNTPVPEPDLAVQLPDILLDTSIVDSTLSGTALQKPETCPGALIDYGMSMFSHYPWHLHDTDFLGYELSFIDPKGRFLRVQSCKCLGRAPGGKGSACSACNQIVPGIQVDNIELESRPITLSELLEDSDILGPTVALPLDTAVEDSFCGPRRLGDDELSIEHLLPATGSSIDATDLHQKGWLKIDDKPVHLESAVRYLLGSDGGAKSTDRLRRVCGFTKYLHQSTAKPEPSTLR